MFMRVLDLSIWALCALCLLPAVVRTFTTKRQLCDDHKAAMFFIALWMVGNYGVRLLDARPSLLALYGLNAIAAGIGVLILILVRQGRPANGNR